MKVIAGRFTLVLTTIVCGFLLLLYWFLGLQLVPDLWVYSPVLLVILGTEILFLNGRYGRSRNVKIEIGAGNIILIAVILALFMMGTAKINVGQPVLDNLLNLTYYFRQKI